jgi:serine/threonine protein phosphatase PrpC
MLQKHLTTDIVASPETIGVAMQAAFLELDDDLLKLPSVASGDDHSGCTAIVSVITDTHIIVANAGDARGILQQGDIVRPMSFDHKPTNQQELKRIEAAGGCVSMRRVNGDLAVSRALGDFEYKKTATMPAKDQMVSAFPDIEIAERNGAEEFLLLCCDGIWDVMSNDDAGIYIRAKLSNGYTGMNYSLVCEKLLDKCLEKGSRDNMSVVTVVNPKAASLGDKPPPSPPTKVNRMAVFSSRANKWCDRDIAVREDGTMTFSIDETDIVFRLANSNYNPKLDIRGTDYEDDFNRICFSITCKKDTYLLDTFDEKERTEWCDGLKAAGAIVKAK